MLTYTSEHVDSPEVSMGDMSDDGDVAIVDLSSSEETDDGSLIDAYPPSDPSSPVLGTVRPGRQASVDGFLAGADVRSPGSEDGQCCTICFESWSNSGEHRIASLRCGHLFGKSCIERWLRGREQRCPQCNAKACRRDVRVIFAKSLRVLDTTDRDRAMEELDREREARRRLELDYAVVQVKCQMKENQIEKLQAELRALRDRVGGGGGGGGPENGAEGGGGSPRPGEAEATAKLSLHCNLEVSRPGGCRVLEHNAWLGMLVASQPSQNSLFPGHGVRKINTLDMRPLQFVSLHQKQIRDVRFSPEQRDLLLSVSLDRRAKITNVCGNTLVQTYECAAPVWSCAWDRDAPHTFYAGLQSGAVVAFDTRAGCEPLMQLEGGSPVVALRHVPRGGQDGAGGLLACRLADCALQEVTGRLRAHPLPLHGPFVSADFDERTRHVLVSSRPSSRQPHAQHAVCRLRRAPGPPGEPDAPPLAAEVVQVFRGGTSQRVLSRSALVPHPLRPDAPLVCASQETAQVTQLWDLASGECCRHTGRLRARCWTPAR
ncbi:E3 ubiquitin-protein ligase RFWD3 [Amphibalanus amphitrite]|uniref:RING-type E3 ubiquitin transferase n=1 Tax=Amphibalanus amphitrite TaxID=1232801 RepID=A0A6A4WUB0_AMPAM|nr:E3 ubiquitin-protein ligase RFWD3 [Amphibalanus amphitrite]